jgi:hypothetical protein
MREASLSGRSSRAFAQHCRAHNRLDARQFQDLWKVGFHTRVVAHRLDGGGCLPLGVDDDSRTVCGDDQSARLPAVKGAGHCVDLKIWEDWAFPNYVKPPFPAWTAIQVSRLIPTNGITEIKIVAKLRK